MHHVRGVPREQAGLFPERLEDFVPGDHPVRVVDAFMGMIDAGELGFAKATPEATGRPPYDPADLLKLYVYGYVNQIRSSRRLERECRRNVELMWLMHRLAPDFKTIANFRKDNSGAIRAVCRAFVRFCREQALFSCELVAIDGSKFPAAASRKRAHTRGQVERELAAIDARIETYLSTLDAADETERDEQEENRTAGALAALSERKEQLQALAAQMLAEERSQIIEGEPDAQLMGHAPTVVGYNVQTAVDEKHKLIVHHEVVNETNDRRQLLPVARAAKEALQSDTLRVVADTGYHNAEQARRCEEEGIEPAVPMQREPNADGPYFTKEGFTYDAETDTFRCPAGQNLTFRGQHKGRRGYTTKACGACPLRPQCTNGKQRWITRAEDSQAAERADRRAREGDLMRKRRTIVEHPFASLKRMLGGRLLSRGIDNAKAEIALAVLGYNMLRAINILGTRNLLLAIR